MTLTEASIPAKFSDPDRTAKGDVRAQVPLDRLTTLWVNTGTLCNLTCRHCYIESSPTNDRLAYFRRADLAGYLDEIEGLSLGTREIAFTGGEPFMNPEIMAMLGDVLARGHRALVLTNAMKPMEHKRAALAALRDEYGGRLVLRVSVDHFDGTHHDEERGSGTFRTTLNGLKWLASEGFATRVAARTRWGGDEASMRRGFADLFARESIALDAADAEVLVLFPELDETADVPEITNACWGILGVAPSDIMCASSRMVVRRRGAGPPSVLACTLIAYDDRFELGTTLAQSQQPVALNHPHCARFCVLGGGACSRGR